MTEATIRISEIQKSLKAPKGQMNSFGNYKYRSLEDIMEAVKPLLKEDEFVTLSDDIVMVGDRFYVKATACFQKGSEKIDVHAFARESLDKKGMDSAQITGATSSYARKYACNGLFAIDDTKDADSEDNSDAGDWVNIGVRVPNEYWDLLKGNSEKGIKADPKAAQERIGGPDYKAEKVEDSDFKKKGWFIFAKKGVKFDLPVKESNEVLPKVLIGAPELKKTAPGDSQNDDPVISTDQQLELVKIVKEKGIHHFTAKKLLKDKFGYDGTGKIQVSRYLEVYDFFKSFAPAGVGQ